MATWARLSEIAARHRRTTVNTVNGRPAPGVADSSGAGGVGFATAPQRPDLPGLRLQDLVGRGSQGWSPPAASITSRNWVSLPDRVPLRRSVIISPISVPPRSLHPAFKRPAPPIEAELDP